MGMNEIQARLTEQAKQIELLTALVHDLINRLTEIETMIKLQRSPKKPRQAGNAVGKTYTD